MDTLIKNMEQYAQLNNIPIMQKDGIDFLCTFIQKHKIKRILEIGTAIGYSAICMANLDKDIHVTTIERDASRYLEALNNIKQANKKNQILVYHADALNFEIKETFDLIFIDAAKAQYIKFFEHYKTNLNKGGYIISDNLKFHGLVNHIDKVKNRNTKQLVRKIQRYITYLEEHTEYTTKFYDVGDGVAISKRNE